ncbi:MAG: hypothetical protein ACLQGV_08215 [Bryobacteraceae bacterium]
MSPIGGHRAVIPVLLLAACFQAATVGQEFKAGGVALTLPGPASDFPEVGDKLRTTVFELLAPSTNRLLSAYVPSDTLARLNQGKQMQGLDLYAMVEVPRQMEYTDCTAKDFEQVLESAGPSLGKVDANGIIESAAEEINFRLKSLGAKPVAVDHPEILGGLFKKADVAAFAMLMSLKSGDRSVTMAGGMAVLRIKQRLVFVYLFRRYESPETVNWLHKNLETWCDSILAKNR